MVDLGKIYCVLSIEQAQGRWLYRLIGDGGNGVALFHVESFETVSSELPNTWIASWREGGLLHLTPRAWAVPGFWERYYDRDPDAVRVFNEEAGKILEADV